ncbi:MAG TPA: long-chain-acyl-CoA synthetase [Xanthobacteraceae bacterium]|jgi:fatty-acyl-CoA synthase|nr:long-chain-acyl-CoA synthetase [Xanthobacteraceae bacterium]
MELIDRLRADVTSLRGALRTLKLTTPIAKNPTRVFPQVILELADRYDDAPALLSDCERLSYRELAARCNRYAHWALTQNLRKGDTVCLMMPGRPEFVAAWIGITRVGGVVALINTQLTGTALAYCINVVSPKHIIVAAELFESLQSARAHMTGEPKLWLHGEDNANFPRIDRAVDSLPGEHVAAADLPKLTIEDRALYIYTSGTTGLPKAANVNHYRVMLASYAFAGVMDTQSSDRMYDCLPLYHTAGGVVATGALLVNGGSVVIRDKFSAREFWDDVVRWDCTCFQYIGELCRYLVNSPPNPNERKHHLRLAYGNGLRPDVWPQFKRRFQIPQIIEFYAATEGNVSLFNFDGKEAAVGRLPWWLARRFPIKIVRFDPESQQPIRDNRGFCIECQVDEPGEVIGKIIKHASKPGQRFEGYASEIETDRKILHDVFKTGDLWFRTGDLMRKDKNGYFYFIDRVGDTFRWKGENVSTTEVEEAVGRFDGILESNVYGVQIAGRDGRAGMAAIVAKDNLNLTALRDHIAQQLPEYARPVFLRIRKDNDLTTTFKQKKINLLKEGFDPSRTSDPIYFNDPQRKAFVRLDPALYEQINSGRVRL